MGGNRLQQLVAHRFSPLYKLCLENSFKKIIWRELLPLKLSSLNSFNKSFLVISHFLLYSLYCYM